MFDALSIVERKNPWGAIRAFERAFPEAVRRGRCRLVIKVVNLHFFPPEARRLREEMKRVDGILIEDHLHRLRTNALIAACDVYLSLHRTEGYGLTIAEAMYLGKPVIAPAYSGNMDFMTPDNSYMVPYRLVKLERDYPPYDRGNVWAEPDSDAAAVMLRSIFDRPGEGASPRRMGETDDAGRAQRRDRRIPDSPATGRDTERDRPFSFSAVDRNGRGRRASSGPRIAIP